MLTKKYEVYLIDRNKFDDLLHKTLLTVYPKDKVPTVDVGYGRGKYFEELNGYSIRNTIHIDFNYRLPDEEATRILQMLRFKMNIPQIEKISMGYTYGGESVIIIEFDCELFDPSWDY